jgi:hypothetical protein
MIPVEVEEIFKLAKNTIMKLTRLIVESLEDMIDQNL